jgi:hypothetical protein
MISRAARHSEPGGAAASGILLALLVAVTRIPFFARSLFEFDSVNYAVALTRFDLAQDTPHFPGYPLHVGIGKLLFLFFGDANRAFVWESFLLSLGAVLCVWMAARRVAPARVALYAAVVWAVNPFLWFYGCVATVYAHEAFFTSLVGMFGIMLLTSTSEEQARPRLPLLLVGAMCVAGAARPSMLVFLFPAVILALLRARIPRRVWWIALVVAASLTAIWICVLVGLAGGVGDDLRAGGSQLMVRRNSVFLDGNPERHVAMALKCLLYLAIGTSPFWTLALFTVARDRSHSVDRAIRAIRNPVTQFLWLLSAAPLTFYLLVFYAKPGYLLNIFAVGGIGGAMLLGGMLSRPHVPRRAGILWMSAWGLAWCVWFLMPMPWKSHDVFFEDSGRASSTFETFSRYTTLSERMNATIAKVFEYSSSDGIAAVDEMNEAALAATRNQPTIIATWWGMWGVEYRRSSIVYLLEVTQDYPMSVWRGEQGKKTRVTDSIVQLPAQNDVVLFLSRDHWLYEEVSKQVRLEPLVMPVHLEAWRIGDTHFRVTINGTTFVR